MASVDISKLMLCKQKMNDVKVLYADGITATIPARNVFFFSIEKNFFNDFLPIFRLKCLVDYDMYKSINEKPCSFGIDITKFQISSANTNYDKTKVMTKSFISGIFTNSNTGDKTPNMYENVSNRKSNDSLEKPNEFQKGQIELELFLFQQEGLAYTTLNDNIFANCDVFSALLGLATVTNQRRMLMTYPKNNAIYNNIVIPNNLTFIGGVDFLQAVYGIYDKGYCLFSDFNAMYLVDKDVNCTAFERNEIKRVYISYTDKTTGTGNINGQIEDLPYRCYRINSTRAPEVSDMSDTTSKLLAPNVNTVNTKGGSNISSSTDAKVLDNKYNNEFSISSYKYEKNMVTGLTADFKEIDLDIMKVNKEFYFTFDITTNSDNFRNSEGLYKLAAVQAIYEKKDDQIFENTVRAKFVRV